MLLCEDGSYYIGVTHDVELRAGQHNAGHFTGSYTITRIPVQLVYAADFRDASDAIRWEKQIKKWSPTWQSAPAQGKSSLPVDYHT